METIGRTRTAFFDGVAHEPAAFGDTLLAAAFYEQASSFNVVFTVSTRWARQALAGTPLRPVAVAPGRAALTISALRYQECDIGPYDELIVGLPVGLTGWGGPVSLLRWLRLGGGLFVWHVGVTTEIARDLGVEVLGWPKRLADVAVDVGSDPVACSASVDGQTVLSLAARRPRCRSVDDRQRFDMFAARGDHLLRCQSVNHLLQSGFRIGGGDIDLTLGDHPIGDELRRAGLGRPFGVTVVPRHELVLSGSLESWLLPHAAEQRPQPAP